MIKDNSLYYNLQGCHHSAVENIPYFFNFFPEQNHNFPCCFPSENLHTRGNESIEKPVSWHPPAHRQAWWSHTRCGRCCPYTAWSACWPQSPCKVKRERDSLKLCCLSGRREVERLWGSFGSHPRSHHRTEWSREDGPDPAFGYRTPGNHYQNAHF